MSLAVDVRHRLERIVIDVSFRAGGGVAFSSGNHAQGVAAAAQLLSMPAVIVMPQDAPRPKRERTQALGAEVVLYDRAREDREALARGIAEARGATLVPPYDDPLVMETYLKYCRRAIEFFEPDYLCIGIEVNEIHRDGGAAKWGAR